MGQKHRRAKNNRHRKEEITKKLVFPENKHHEEREPGVPGKKVIPLERNEFIKVVPKAVVECNLPGINTHMREAQEKRAENRIKREGLEAEKQFAGFHRKKRHRKNPECESRSHNHEVEINDGKIIKKDVAYEMGACCGVRRIVPGTDLNEQAEKHKRKTQIEGLFIALRPKPVMFGKEFHK